MGQCNSDLNRFCCTSCLLVGVDAIGLLYDTDFPMTSRRICCNLTVEVFNNVNLKSCFLRAERVYF